MAHSPSIASNPLPRRGREFPGGGVGSLSSAYSMSSLRPTIVGCTRNQAWSSGHWSSEREVRPGTKGLVPNEKEVLRDVNGRFSAFIDKVHRLEVENEKLEAEVLQLRDAQASVLESTKPLRAEVEGLRDLIRNLGLQKAADQLTSQRLEEDIQALWSRGEQEARIRESTEATIKALENEISHAHRVKADLHQKVQSFLEEIEALKKSHEEDMGALRSHLQSTIVGAEKKQSEDLSSTLRDIRALLLSQPTGDLSQAEEWFRIEAAKLSQADQTSMGTLQAARQELKMQARQLQGKSAELDEVLQTRGSLERQITELEERHDAETCHLQDILVQLERELKRAQLEVAGHLHEYQDLLRVKDALDTEIISYRNLLEHEERRLGTVSEQSAIFSTTKRHAPTRFIPIRIPPQYKFVEEIITETREVSMSEAGDTEEDVMSAEELDDLCSQEETQQPRGAEIKAISGKIIEEPGEVRHTNAKEQHQTAVREKTAEMMSGEAGIKEHAHTKDTTQPGKEDRHLEIDDKNQAGHHSPNAEPKQTSRTLTVEEEIVATGLTSLQTMPEHGLVQQTLVITNGSKTGVPEDIKGGMVSEEAEDYCHPEKTQLHEKIMPEAVMERGSVQENTADVDNGTNKTQDQQICEVTEAIAEDTKVQASKYAEQEDTSDRSAEDPGFLVEQGSLMESKDHEDTTSPDPESILIPVTACILQEMTLPDLTDIAHPSQAIEPMSTTGGDELVGLTDVEGGEVAKTGAEQHQLLKEDEANKESQEESEMDALTAEKEKKAEQRGDGITVTNNIKNVEAISTCGDMREARLDAEIKEEILGDVTTHEVIQAGENNLNLRLKQEGALSIEAAIPTAATEGEETSTKHEGESADLTPKLTTSSQQETLAHPEEFKEGSSDRTEAPTTQKGFLETKDTKLIILKPMEYDVHTDKASDAQTDSKQSSEASEVIAIDDKSRAEYMEDKEGETTAEQDTHIQLKAEDLEINLGAKQVPSEKGAGVYPKPSGTIDGSLKEVEETITEEKGTPEPSSNVQHVDFTEGETAIQIMVEERDNRNNGVLTDHISGLGTPTLERMATPDISTTAQEALMANDLSIPVHERHVIHDLDTQDQEQVMHDSSMPAQLETSDTPVPNDGMLHGSQEEQVIHKLSTPERETRVIHVPFRSDEGENVIDALTAHGQEEEVTHPFATLAPEEKITPAPATEDQEEKVIPDSSSTAQEHIIQELSKTAQEGQGIHDASTPNQEAQVSYELSIPAQEEPLIVDLPTSDQVGNATDAITTQDQEDEVIHDLAIQDQEEVICDSPTPTQMEQVTPAPATQDQEEKVILDASSPAQEYIIHELSTQRVHGIHDASIPDQEAQVSHGLSTLAQEEQLIFDLSTSDQAGNATDAITTQDQEDEVIHDLAIQAQEEEVIHDLAIQAQEEEVIYDSPTLTEEGQVTHVLATQDQKDTVIPDSSPAEEGQLSHELSTQAQEADEIEDSSTPVQAAHVIHDLSTSDQGDQQDQEEDAIHDLATQAQEKEVICALATPAEEEPVNYVPATQCQEEKVIPDLSSPAQEDQAIHELSTQAQEAHVIEDSSTPDHETQLIYKLSTSAQEAQVIHDASTPDQGEQATDVLTMQDQEEEVIHDLATQAQEKEVICALATPAEEEPVNYVPATQYQEEKVIPDLSSPAQEDQAINELSTQAQEAHVIEDSSTPDHDAQVIYELSTSAQEAQVIHDASTPDQGGNKTDNLTTQDQEEVAIQDLATEAQEEAVICALPTPADDKPVTHDTATQDQEEKGIHDTSGSAQGQVIHELSTPPQAAHVMHDISTSYQGEPTTDAVTMQGKGEELIHDLSIQAQEEDVISVFSTPTQEEQVASGLAGQDQEEKVIHNSSSPAQEDKVAHDVPTPAQGEQDSHALPIQDQEEEVIHDLPTPDQKAQMICDVSIQGKDEQVVPEDQRVQDLSTKAEDEEPNHSLKQPLKEKMIQDLSTHVEDGFHASPLHAQENEMTHEISIHAVEEHVTRDLAIHALEEYVTLDLATQIQKEEQVTHDLFVLDKEEQITCDLLTQDEKEQVFQDLSQDQREQMTDKSPTQIQEEQIINDLSSQDQEENKTHDLSTQYQEKKVIPDVSILVPVEQESHDLTAQAQDGEDIQELHTQVQEQHMGQDVPTQAGEAQGSHAIPDQVSEAVESIKATTLEDASRHVEDFPTTDISKTKQEEKEKGRLDGKIARVTGSELEDGTEPTPKEM